MEYTKEEMISQTQGWIEKVVIGLNFCPFARKPFVQDRIRYAVVANEADILQQVALELQILDNDAEVETTLLLLPSLGDFEAYLDKAAEAQYLLEGLSYEGIYQIATFHPKYCFEGSQEDDPSNYTNRSPWAMLHLLREASLTAALEGYDKPEQIPVRNVAVANEMGIEKLKGLFNHFIKTNRNV